MSDGPELVARVGGLALVAGLVVSACRAPATERAMPRPGAKASVAGARGETVEATAFDTAEAETPNRGLGPKSEDALASGPSLDAGTPDAPSEGRLKDDPVCRRPVEDYGPVTLNGETLNRRTLGMLETAMALYTGPADLKRVAQGSYTDAVEGSFGTHAGGGAVDLSIRNPAAPAERLYDEVPALLLALRQAGFAAWYRDWNEVFAGSVPHIHAIAVGDAELSEAARAQLDGPAGYFRGFNGLPLDPPVADGQGGPLRCPWMEAAEPF